MQEIHKTINDPQFWFNFALLMGFYGYGFYNGRNSMKKSNKYHL